jgi:hypothetical protein
MLIPFWLGLFPNAQSSQGRLTVDSHLARLVAFPVPDCDYSILKVYILPFERDQFSAPEAG